MSDTLLVVEDDPLIASFVLKALGKWGYDTDWVVRGREALTRLEAGDIALVLLDLGLPDIDGLDVLRELREGGSEVPVLVVTSRTDPKDRGAAVALGVDGYLMKPFPLMTLLEAVRASLSSRVAPE